ncbi:GTPase HflX [Candidatus Cardinium hertigii]|uniref:GTPase HflX n=1 Tax=Candidatus Cardinium hertigii TaxID=247481 RepID=A0A3N2QBA1_9BACT|nr:GTPase HflX [Candidatus Cardinium hertigii]ROT47088.1 GTPase HflX [Candidatus Cardinium hertigii]
MPVALSTSKTAILIALTTLTQPLAQTEEYVAELAFLARTWGLEIVKTFIQRLDHPHSATFVGKGKIEEIADCIKTENIGYAIFDDELSPPQVRNLEKLLSCQILDRSLLILNIFSMRAQTKQAKTQVELAKYQYVLPRLTRMWTHLSSQKGGSAGMRGPGEKELETDKRVIQNKITILRKKLAAIEKQCATRRKARINLVRISLVGYTNVGKSTLMKLLSKTNILADNKLFATVDATVRKVFLNNNAVLLTDTVGFIRKLPHTLIECFKSTLTEIKEADVLLHIIDASHPSFQEHIKIVDQTLTEIGAENVPRILVFNKIDAIEPTIKTVETSQEGITTKIQEVDTLKEVILKKGHYSNAIDEHNTVFISAKQQLHIDLLKEIIIKEIEPIQARRYIKTGY